MERTNKTSLNAAYEYPKEKTLSFIKKKKKYHSLAIFTRVKLKLKMQVVNLEKSHKKSEHEKESIHIRSIIHFRENSIKMK